MLANGRQLCRSSTLGARWACYISATDCKTLHSTSDGADTERDRSCGPLQGIKVCCSFATSCWRYGSRNWEDQTGADSLQVLDLGQVVAGNFCGATLAYFGADVIKVEPPGTGDALRSLRTTDKSGNSLWWRSYVSFAFGCVR